MVLGWTVFSFGLSVVFTLAADLMVTGAPPERAGAASDVAETSSELGGALGIGVLGAIGAAVYRSQLPADGHVADTIGAAVLGGGGAGEAARAAFAQGLHVAAVLSAILAVLAAAALFGLRRQEGNTHEAAGCFVPAEARA